MTRLGVAMVGLGAWALPAVAMACPVCFAAKNDESRVAFIITTGVLTGLPLALIGGLIFWVMKRSKAIEAESVQDRVDHVSAP